jgi:hypothetical protein
VDIFPVEKTTTPRLPQTPSQRTYSSISGEVTILFLPVPVNVLKFTLTDCAICASKSIYPKSFIRTMLAFHAITAILLNGA